MANTFGGFSGNADIDAFLTSITSEFVDMVVSHSVLLEGYQRKSETVINVAKHQVYPRVGLRLGAAKNKNNAPLFSTALISQSQLASSGFDSIRDVLFTNIIFLMTGEKSPYAEGITNVVAALTAAILIKSIPLNNDIKNMDLSADIEKRAFEDLELIVKIYSTDTVIAATDIQGAAASKLSIFLAMDIDKATLPANWFDVGTRDERVVLETSQPNANVRPLSAFSIPSSSVAFGWFFLSGTEYEGVEPAPTGSITPALTIHPPTEGAFLVRNGKDVDEVITDLSDAINDACFARDTNVICSPNTGELTVSSVNVVKKRLYPNEVDKTYERKIMAVRLDQRINSLSFSSRRLSSVVTSELIILKFFTISKEVMANNKFANSSLLAGTTLTYIGPWVAGTAYAKGSIVDVGSQASFVAGAAITNLTTSPNTNPQWLPLYTNPDDLVAFKGIAEDSIEGLLYGLTKSYSLLDLNGPKSLLLRVENGALKTISTAAAPKAATNNNVIDTFYFKLEEGFTSVTGTLKVRASSTNVTALPLILPFLNPLDNTITVTVENATAEDVAVEVLKKLYVISQYTEVLSALVFPHALQLTCFRRTNQEIKEVIDILSLPLGLELATGTSLVTKTPYKNKARSVIVEATPIPTSTASSKKLVTDNKPGAADAAKIQVSPKILSVKDKLNFISRGY